MGGRLLLVPKVDVELLLLLVVRLEVLELDRARRAGLRPGAGL